MTAADVRAKLELSPFKVSSSRPNMGIQVVLGAFIKVETSPFPVVKKVVNV